MKVALLFLTCFVSATWQQNPYWPYYSNERVMPFYSNNMWKEYQDYLPVVASVPAVHQNYLVMDFQYLKKFIYIQMT